MDVPLAVLADSAIQSADGKLSVIGIFGAIRAAKFPAQHPSCTLVLQLRASPGERGQQKTVLVRLMDEDSELAQLTSEFQVPEEFEFPTQPFTITQLLELRGLVLPRPGEYAFYVLVNGEEKARVAFQAVLIERPN